jgi:hypothetical protein
VNVTCNIKHFSPFPVEERFLVLVQPTFGVVCQVSLRSDASQFVCSRQTGASVRIALRVVLYPETHRGVEFLTCAHRGLSVVLVNVAECNASVCVDTACPC